MNMLSGLEFYFLGLYFHARAQLRSLQDKLLADITTHYDNAICQVGLRVSGEQATLSIS